MAILTEASVHVPGDERSRSAPGHGYPAHISSYWDIEVFSSREEWETEISKLKTQAFSGKSWLPVLITPARVTTSISVDVEV